MRVTSLLALPVALLAAACAHVPPLQATDPSQAIDGAPNEAQAELSGVTVHATIGGWRGQPRTLEQRLTPVDVTVLNSSKRVIRIGPEAFTLQTPGGPQRVLTQDEAAQLAADTSPGMYRPRVGAVGNPTFPGYDSPGDPTAPWNRSPRGTPVPPLSQWYDSQAPGGTLSPGSQTSIMLFFGTPAHSLASATFEVELVDVQGNALGTVRLPFARD